ncbi:hypothetical protein WHR41_06523 [Cladosporium halotolerans]|uniref:CENP-V/GFA domain-containing protein n=1 Tax=Cladosporium halotolerans TaxID=1052096 RepID=A0AB34KMT8_9PEZI
MPKGGCACGKVRVEWDSEPSAKALCHCADCKKISGSAYSTNIIIPNEGFKITSGSPKTWAKRADSGADVTTSFCGDCGTNMWRTTPTFGENRVVKVGILDDLSVLNSFEPAVELYAPERVSWLKKQEGAAQLKAMPGSEEVA